MSRPHLSGELHLGMRSAGPLHQSATKVGHRRRRGCITNGSRRSRASTAGLLNGLPRAAREGAMRVWLDILSQRHPGVSWIPADADQSELAKVVRDGSSV